MNKTQTTRIKQVRTVWNENEQKWYFVVSDVIRALSKTKDAKDYTKKLRKYDRELAKVWSKIVCLLEADTNSGKQKISCAKALDLLTIILSLRSRRAKLFVKWVENLEIKVFNEGREVKISKKSMNEFFDILEYPDYWIEKREQYALINEKQASIKKMNELEIVFLLLEQNDIIYRGKAKD